jgi:phosphoribosyl-ATP pyrophosphohydrolase
MSRSYFEMLDLLTATIRDRKAHPRAGSYTTSLFDKGLDEISKKVGEEAVEVIIAAHSQTRERLVSELADLTYHTLVLLAQTGVTLDDVADELRKRHAPKQES